MIFGMQTWAFSKMVVFRVVAPCRLVRVYQRFICLFCLHQWRYNPEDSHLYSHRLRTSSHMGIFIACEGWSGDKYE
jgi:putative component of membrane protein insertase Oxa1/YidC/SpoIIIJ protein YidD